MATERKDRGSQPEPGADIAVRRDPDNPQTVILSRWPTEEEKPNVHRRVREVRGGSA